MKDTDSVAIMFANLGGSKKKPSGILKFAEACRMQVKKMRTYDEVARTFHKSRTMIAQIDKINDLSSEAKKLVEEAGIDRSFQASRLPTSRQAEVLASLMDLKANPDARLFVDYLLENPELRISEAKKRFLNTLPKKEKIHIIAIPLNSDKYDKLRQFASSQKKGVHDLILSLVEGYLDAQEKKAR